MKDFDSIEKKISLLDHQDRPQYISEMLEIFGLPKILISKVNQKFSSDIKSPVAIYRRALIFIFDETSEKYKAKLYEGEAGKTYSLIIGFGNSEIWLKNNLSNSEISFDYRNINKYIDYFLPLVEGVKNEKDLYTTLDFSEIIGRLYNQLLKINPNKKDGILNFLFDLIFIAFSQSVIKNQDIDRFLQKYEGWVNKNFNFIISNFINCVLIKNTNQFDDFNLPEWRFKDTENYDHPQLDQDAFNLCIRLLKQNLIDLDFEILGSLVYRFVGEDEKKSIYGHFTTYENVNKVLFPLFIEEFEEKINKNITDKEQLKVIRNELLSLNFFDPTNGPGSFLTAAFNSVSNLLDLIDSNLDTSSNFPEDISLTKFVALVDNQISFKMTNLSLWVSYLQHIVRFRDIKIEDLINSYKTLNINYGNQLIVHWETICKNNGKTLILGSPIFKGEKKLSSDEKKQITNVFKTKTVGDLDYSSCWLYLASNYIKKTKSKCAFVITNSICQGVQVGRLWNEIYSNNCEIFFARRSFKWLNTSEGKTGVTVIIIGLVSNEYQPNLKKIYEDNSQIGCDLIGPYLIKDSKAIILKRSSPISSILPKMPKGNMPYDNQYLLLDNEEKNYLLKNSPEASKFLKRIVGSDEFINNIKRWCLWISDSEYDEAMQIKFISDRIKKVRDFRLSKQDRAAKKLADKPYQFREFRICKDHTLVIPSVSSEKRKYIPIGFVSNDTVVSNLAFAIHDCEPWVFGVISSKMHMIWVRSVCGSLETRIRYSSTLGYNTFPFPNISKQKKEEIGGSVMEILSERENFCNRSLGSIYSDLPQSLINNHKKLDLIIDDCYQTESFNSDTERINFLFKLYENKK